jgi:hypothetical protein
MTRCLAMLLTVILAQALVQAQPDPAKQPGGGQPGKPNPAMQPVPPPSPNSIAMEVTPEGLFVAAGGVLMKYDARTLEPRGKAELLGPPPAPPAPAAAAQPVPPEQQNLEMMRWRNDQMKRNAPPGLLVAGNALIVVFSDQVFQVNQRTLEIEAKADLSDPRMPMSYWTPPVMKMNGDLLYVIRYPYIVSVDLKAGKLLGRATIPGVNMPVAPPIIQPNQPGGVGKQPAAPAQPIVVVGTLKQVQLEGGFWVFKDEQGNEYVLQGDLLRQLLATPELDGKRVRIQGTPSQAPGVAMYGKGYLKIERYELLK